MTEAQGRGALPAEPLEPGSRGWLTVGILLLIVIVSYLDRGIIALVVGPIQKSLQITDVQMSLLLGLAFGLFYALFAFPLGWLADRWSRRGVIWLCMSGWSLATTGCGLAQSFWQLAAARVAIGMGEGGLPPAAYRMIAEAVPKRRLALAIGLFGAGASLGSPLAIMVGGVLVQKATEHGTVVLTILGAVEPWQLVFLVLGPPGLLIAPIIFLVPRTRSDRDVSARDSASPRSARGDGFPRFLRSRRRYLSLHFLGFGLITLLGYGVMVWAPTFFVRRFGLNIAEVATHLGLVTGGAELIGFPGGGWVVDRWHALGVDDAHLRYFVFVTPLAGACAVLAFAVAKDPFYAFVFLGGVHMLVPFTGPAVGHLQLATPEAYRGRVNALFTLSFNLIGLTFGPLVVALLTEHVFKDPSKIGLSAATLGAFVGVSATVVFIAALAPAREAVRSSHQFARPKSPVG